MTHDSVYVEKFTLQLIVLNHSHWLILADIGYVREVDKVLILLLLDELVERG